MKQIKFFAMALAAMSMFSCSTEEAADATIPDGGDGSTTYAQFTLKMPEATRVDNNATTMESKIREVYVYLVSKGVVEKKQQLTLVGADWTSGAIQIASGQRQIFAVVNGFTSYSYIANDPVGLLTEKRTGIVTGGGVFKVETPVENSYVAFSGQISANLTGGTEAVPAKFTIPVSRVTSKVVVKGDNLAMDPSLTAVTYRKKGNAAATGDVSRAAFALVAMAKNSYLFQRTSDLGYPLNPPTSGAPETAGGDMTWEAWPANNAAATYYSLTKDAAALSAISGLHSNNADRGGIYTLENAASAGNANNKTTQLIIRVALRPKAIIQENGTSQAQTEGDAAVPTYFLLKNNNNINDSKFFASAVAVTKWLGDNAAIAGAYEKTAVEYTTGFHYYSVPILNDKNVEANKYSLVRNTIYTVNLGAVSGFGSNDSGKVVIPGDPVESKAWIEAIVTIQDWNVKSQNTPLE